MRDVGAWLVPEGDDPLPLDPSRGCWLRAQHDLPAHRHPVKLPGGDRRSRVGLDEIGVALIARLARDQQHAQRGLGAWLLQQALHRIIDADEHLAIRAVMVDALNKRAATWYQSWGFKSLPGGPGDRLWLPMKRVRSSLSR